MQRETRLRTNTPPVVYETVGGETILVHLETGTYYDLNASGGFVFEAFASGSTIEAVLAAATAQFDADSSEVAAGVERFVERALGEELLTPDDGTGAPPPPGGADGAAGDAEAGESADGGEWSEPALNKHTDMQELLMLDPVHEVDPGGWPARA